MGRAFLIAFLAGPLPFLVWSTALLRASRPDLIALNAGAFVLTIPWLWLLIRAARRPHFLLCWFATAGAFFWAAVREAVLGSGPAASRAAAVALFPVTGSAALLRDGAIMFPILLFVWGTVAGFVRILRRSAAPKYEREEAPERKDDEEPPEPPRPEPYFVPRPPPKPKGPAYTPPGRETPPPRPKRVPGV